MPVPRVGGPGGGGGPGDRADSWLAVAEPGHRARPVSEVTRAGRCCQPHRHPLWPCVDQVGISKGITDAPQVRLTTDEALPPEWLDNISYLEWGGAWVETSRVWTQTKLAAELPGGPPRLPWGHVFEVRYPYPTGQFDLRWTSRSAGLDAAALAGRQRLPRHRSQRRYPAEEEQEEKRPQIGNNGQLSPPDRRSRNGRYHSAAFPEHARCGNRLRPVGSARSGTRGSPARRRNPEAAGPPLTGGDAVPVLRAHSTRDLRFPERPPD